MKGELSRLCQLCRKMAERGNSTTWIHLKRVWRASATQNGNDCGLHKNGPNDKVTICCSCVIKMLRVLQFPGCIWVRLSDTPMSHSVTWNERHWSRSQYRVLWAKTNLNIASQHIQFLRLFRSSFMGWQQNWSCWGGPLSSGCVCRSDVSELWQDIQRSRQWLWRRSWSLYRLNQCAFVQ